MTKCKTPPAHGPPSRSRTALRLLLAVHLMGCGAGATDNIQGIGSPRDPLPVSTPPSPFAIPPTHGQLALPFIATIKTDPGGRLSAVFGDGLGWVSVSPDARENPAFVYYRHPSPPFDEFQALAVTPSGLLVVWLYCRDANLLRAYWEYTAGGGMDTEPVTGACAYAPEGGQISIDMPATVVALSGFRTGFDVRGEDLHLPASGGGAMRLSARSWTVHPFSVVDCSECGTPGWYELHALFWTDDVADTCFGIFYLRADDHAHATLNFVMCLPTLTDLHGGGVFEATW